MPQGGVLPANALLCDAWQTLATAVETFYARTGTLNAVTTDTKAAGARGPLPRFKAIAAIDAGRGLGKNGDMPWHIPADLKHFARTTTETRKEGMQNAVLMGRLTAETIPEKYWPLKGRRNAVVTRNPNWTIEGAYVYTDIADALTSLAAETETLYVVGGGQIYALALAMQACEELILTRIHKTYDCDAFFPEFETSFEMAEELARGEHKGVAFTMERWRRKPGA
ncbi:MAG: dihydrofolate reductase [Myxococcales bacterium]|nr:dihydrofolate reductase [Myxococcales bacterium]